MPTSDLIGIANLVVSTITAIAATYLAFLALQNSAKPQLRIVWHRGSSRPLTKRHDSFFSFDVMNQGRWFARPVARDIVVEFQCSPCFRSAILWKGGRGGQNEDRATTNDSLSNLFLTSQPFTLHAGERKRLVIDVHWGGCTGSGSIVARAHSLDGGGFATDFSFDFEE